MCLAVPARIVECDADEATVELQGNRLCVSRVLTPDANPGDWVLIHAGFAISTIEAEAALETWSYLDACYGGAAEAMEETNLHEGADT